MAADYVVKKSAWSAVKWWHLVFFFLIVPLIVMAVEIALVKNYTVEFYDSKKLVVKSGFLSKHEKDYSFDGLSNISVEQTVKGRMFHFGSIKVSVRGHWGCDLRGVLEPYALKAYLEKFEV